MKVRSEVEHRPFTIGVLGDFRIHGLSVRLRDRAFQPVNRSTFDTFRLRIIAPPTHGTRPANSAKERELLSTWHRLYHLCLHSSDQSQIMVLDLTKNQLALEIDLPPELEETTLYYKIVEAPRLQDPAGQFDLLIADFQFGTQPTDTTTLNLLGRLAAAAECPCIVGASSDLLELQYKREITLPRSLILTSLYTPS